MGSSPARSTTFKLKIRGNCPKSVPFSGFCITCYHSKTPSSFSCAVTQTRKVLVTVDSHVLAKKTEEADKVRKRFVRPETFVKNELGVVHGYILYTHASLRNTTRAIPQVMKNPRASIVMLSITRRAWSIFLSCQISLVCIVVSERNFRDSISFVFVSGQI